MYENARVAAKVDLIFYENFATCNALDMPT